MVNLSIKIAGIGGQGVQFIGKLLSDAAFREGLNVSMGVMYEPSTKGGLTVADIHLASGDKEIIYPFIERPEIFICLAQRAWNEYKHTLTDKSIVLADIDNVQQFNVEECECKYPLKLPFSATAIELGSENIANVVALGFVAELLDLGDHFVIDILNRSLPNDAENYDLLEVNPDKFEESLTNASPEKFREMNLEAFRAGYKMSQNTTFKEKSNLIKKQN